MLFLGKPCCDKALHSLCTDLVDNFVNNPGDNQQKAAKSVFPLDCTKINQM
jgi:hypothetical protein